MAPCEHKKPLLLLHSALTQHTLSVPTSHLAGMWYHLSNFYTPQQLGVAYTTVATATTVSGLLGGPLAAGFLALDGLAGVKGWQWLFVMESLPTLAVAVLIRVRRGCKCSSPCAFVWSHRSVETGVA